MNLAPVVIVTAASQGIGAGCARELTARNYKVSLLAANKNLNKSVEP